MKKRFQYLRQAGSFTTAAILLAGAVLSAFVYVRNRESTLYQMRELIVRDAVTMGGKVQSNIEAYQRSVAALREVLRLTPALSHKSFVELLHSTSPRTDLRSCVLVTQQKKAGDTQVLLSHGNIQLPFGEGQPLEKSPVGTTLLAMLDNALPDTPVSQLVRLSGGANKSVHALVVAMPVEDGLDTGSKAQRTARAVFGIYAFNDLVEQALDPTTTHGYDVMACRVTDRGQNEVIFYNQAGLQNDLTPFNIESPRSYASQRFRLPIGENISFIQFTPTTEWLSRNESTQPQIILLLGLSMTCVLATLYVYKSRRADLVQNLVEKRTAELATAHIRLDESRSTLSSLLEAAPDAINGKDNLGRWTFANRAFLQLAGIPENFPYKGLKDEEVIHRAKPGNAKFLRMREELDSLVMFDGQSLRREISIDVPNHPRRHIDIHMVPVRGTDGSIVGLIAVYNDISELRRRIQALQHSRERVKLLVRNTATAIVEWDNHYRVLHWNPAAARLFGYDAEEVQGKPVTFFADPDNQQPSSTAMESFLREKGHTIPQVFRHRNRRSQNITCEWQSTPIIDEEGHQLGVTTFIYDITERSRAEQALRKRDGILRGIASSAAGFLNSEEWEPETAELLRHLLDTLALSRVFIVRSGNKELGIGPTTILEWLNPYWDGTPLLQHENDAGGDKDPHLLICMSGLCDHLASHAEVFGPASTLPPSWGALLAAQGTRSVLLLPLRIENKLWGFLRFDDCRQDHDWSADELDALRVVSSVLAGAIARQVLSKERLQMEKRLLLSQKRESLGLLAGGIARDFNNLVNEILGNASLGRTLSETDSSIDACLADIEASALRAATLCQQMLSYAGSNEAHTGLASPNLILLDVLNALDPDKCRRIHINKDLANGLPIVELDKEQMRQALHAILQNALEAIGNQSGVLDIKTRPVVASEKSPEGTEILIRDSGSGMSAAVRERVFDPFFSTKMAGRGLGLTVAQSIIETHGGSIALDSAPGGGTTVRIFLPSRAPARQSALASSNAPSMTGTVLVIHGSPALGHATALAFQQLGFGTELCDGVERGLQFLLAHPDRYLLVAVDPQAPGAEAATLQRLRLIGSHTPVILLTSSNDCPSGLRHFADEGLAVLLPSELSSESLRGAVASALKS